MCECVRSTLEQDFKAAPFCLDCSCPVGRRVVMQQNPIMFSTTF